jgi:hypothetical protein
MDSARPIAPRTAGEQRLAPGTTLALVMRTTSAENAPVRSDTDPSVRDRPGGYRHRHHRSHGEGPPS